MENNYSYKILPELNLIIQTYMGKVDYKQILHNKFKQKKEKMFKTTFNHIIHMQDSEFDLTADDTSRLINHINQSAYLFEYDKVVFILSNKVQAIKGLLAQGKVQKNTHLKIELCVNIPKAVEALGLTEHIDKITEAFEEIMKELRPDEDPIVTDYTSKTCRLKNAIE
jgi:GH15 family glucan-1,4-alpha-glucosidase